MKTIAPLALAALVTLCGPARALEVKLTAVETEKVARTPAVITAGVPFAKGAVKDVARLAVSAAGKAVPAQFIRTVPWEDGSVRWALMDVQLDAPAGGEVELVVSDAGGNPAPTSSAKASEVSEAGGRRSPAAPVKVDDGPDAVKVSTGPLEFALSKKKSGLFESIKVDGKELINSAGRGLVVYKEGGGEVAAGAPTEVKVEQAGPLRAIVCARGKFPGIHNDLLTYTVRVSAFAGRKHLKVQVWLENQGAMGYFVARTYDDSVALTKEKNNAEWFAFDGMAAELGLGLGESPTAGCEGVEAAGSFKVLQLCKQSLAQQKTRPEDRRGHFYTWDDFEYVITSGGKELKRGARTDGVLTVKGPGGALTAAVRHFWQNYDKAVELDGKTLRLWLWPTEGRWPRYDPRAYYNCQQVWFDTTLYGFLKKENYLLPGAVRKGHEMILDFSGRDAKEASAELSAPLLALAPAEYYASTEAAPGLFAPPEVRTADRECNFKLDSWLRMARSSADPEHPAGIFRGQQQPHWQGWMDFGDMVVPEYGAVGLQYDWTWIMLLNALRTGDQNFLRLAVPMARHRIEVDQLWSDRDPVECRGLQRNDWNTYTFHCGRLWRAPHLGTNWISGVALYYMLTGEPMALECVLRDAEGLKAAWAWNRTNKNFEGRLDPRTDPGALGWSIGAFGAVYDLTADRKWLDEAMELFRTNIGALWKRHGPFLHDPNDQIRGQDYQQEDMKYCYVVAALCELHHRTGDETVLKLLKEGCEKPFPDSFFDAPLFISDLYAYVGLKTGNQAHLKKAANLFAQSFPESRCPPVFLPPDDKTWSRTSAMTLRTGHLLQYAFWKMKAGK